MSFHHGLGTCELSFIYLAVKDFHCFTDKQYFGHNLGIGTSYTDRLWNKQMFSLKGPEWKRIRDAFTPVFTSAKLKINLLLNREVIEQYIGAIEKKVNSGELLDPVITSIKQNK